MMQAAGFATVVAAIFHHLNRVGYEIITPITVQQEEGDFSKPPSIGPSPNCLELEQDFCPIFQTLSPGDKEQCDVHQNGHNSTQVDSRYSVFDNALIWIAIHFLWRLYHRFNSRDPAPAEDDILTEGPVCTKVLLLDKGVLGGFYEGCIHSAALENQRVQEFVEGFSDDLLQALRSRLDSEAYMQVEDCIGVGSMYESWRVGKPLACDLIIPIAPPEPYRFNFQLWWKSVNGIHPVHQAWGRIQLERTIENKTRCLCGMAGLGEDLLCLLHGPQTMTILENLLCSKDTPYLAKDQVIKWFQIAITEAWGQISHKYEFELSFGNQGSPGALKVRFRSGKTIIFNLTPAIRFEDSDAYFVSQFPSNINSSSGTYWTLSFAVKDAC